MTAVNEDRPAADADTQAMREIAEHAGIVPEVVQALYAQERQRLAQQARIQDFIPLLAMKHVREFFLHAGSGDCIADAQHPECKDRHTKRLRLADAAAESRHRDRPGRPPPLLPQH